MNKTGIPVVDAINKMRPSSVKPAKAHICVQRTYKAEPEAATPFAAVVSVNQLVGTTFLPQVAGIFFGPDSHDDAQQLAFHIASVSGLDIVSDENQLV